MLGQKRASVLAAQGPLRAGCWMWSRAPKRLIEWPKPRRNAFLDPRLPGFTDIDLVGWQKTQIRAEIMFHDDGGQVYMKDLRTLAVAEVGPDHMNILRRRTLRDAADALQQVHNGFLTAVGNRSLPANDLAEQKEMLAIEIRHTDPHIFWTRASQFRDQLGQVRNGVPLDARLAVLAEVDAAVETDRKLAAEMGPTGNRELNHVGATNEIMLHHAFVPRRGELVGHQVLLDGRTM